MGASNAIRAYATYGAVLPDHALRVLVYMALVARDGDAEPWFGLGHEALSELALGRKVPSEDDDPKGRAAALKAVRRAMTELQKTGAIRTSARARYGAHHNQSARYRLFLEAPCPDGYRPPAPKAKPEPSDTGRPKPPDAERPPDADASGPVDDEAIGRSVGGHRTFGGLPPDAERPPKEEEEEEERRTKTSVVDAKVEGRAASEVVGSEPQFVIHEGNPDAPGREPGDRPLIPALAEPLRRSSRWRDPETKALEQLADSRSRRAAAERSAAS